MTKAFDETTLRADIARIFGEHGAHAEVFDALVKERNLYKATLEDYADPANWERSQDEYFDADVAPASDVWARGDDVDGFEYAANTLLAAQPAQPQEAQA